MCTSKVLATFVKWFQYVEKKKEKKKSGGYLGQFAGDD